MQVTIVFNRGLDSPKTDVKEFSNTMEQIYGKTRQFLMLYDASRLKSVKPDHIKLLKAAIDDNSDLAETLTIAIAAVMPNIALAPVIQKLFHFGERSKRSVVDVKLCTSLQEAENFLVEKKNMFLKHGNDEDATKQNNPSEKTELLETKVESV